MLKNKLKMLKKWAGRKLRRIKQKLNQWRMSLKQCIPKILKKAMNPLSMLMLCVILVMLLGKLLELNCGLRVMLGVMSGRWLMPKLQKLLARLKGD
jgi:hypothetical protein